MVYAEVWVGKGGDGVVGIPDAWWSYAETAVSVAVPYIP